MALTGDEALVGRVLNDRYLIGERIARGGMASVFQATDQRLDRPVAVKVMHRGLGDDHQFTERFVREAKSAAKLNHRNVVSVFDQGTDGDVTYLVMEYVPGHTLRDVMRDESPMSPYRALELLEQVLIALSAAHAAHIIHRDVKPENVLITPDGDVKVADFGLARAVSAATTATGGTLIGTVSYLAPEIVVNEGADARSDIYACGAMLYEMLTGIKPHSGESPIQVAYKHVHEDIGKPSDIQRGIQPYVDALVARATVRDRDQRSTDARVMLQQVRSVQRALQAGIADDPELTADLMPGARVPVGGASDDTVLVSRGPAATAADSVPTASVGPEATVQWSRGGGMPPAASTAAGLHPPMSPADYKQTKAGQTRSRRGRTLLITAVVLALLAALLGWYIGVGRYDKAPVLVGSTEKVATQNADEAGFVFQVTAREFSETVPSGLVISTDPKPGAKVLPGSTIGGVISRGQDRVKLPSKLKGMTVADATTALAKVDLEVGDLTRRYDEKVDKDDVIRAVDYDSKSRLKRGTVIDLTISKGPKPIKITDYTGKPADDATAALRKVGFKVGVNEEFSDDVKKGIVISQTPNEGTQFKGDTVSLSVSKGPDVIAVPDVLGQKKDAATRILKKAGFGVQTFPGGNYTVKSQSPGAGSKRKRGSTVVISQFDF